MKLLAKRANGSAMYNASFVAGILSPFQSAQAPLPPPPAHYSRAVVQSVGRAMQAERFGA